MVHVCDTFINRPKGSYRPLACKPIVVTTRELRGTGMANKQDLFFLIKPNTFREHATIDLLFTHPPWIVQALQPESRFARTTQNGECRVTESGNVRVVLG